MASLYPSVFPRPPDQHDPEFRMYEMFGRLPDNYRVFYSKKFKGPQFQREESEVDFIVFDGKGSLLCVEVKGGVLKYDGREESWYQNGKRLARSPERQASAANAAVIKHLGPLVAEVNVGWMVCFPDCCLPDGAEAPPGLPLEVLVDESDLIDISGSINQVEQYYAERFKRAGATPADAHAIIDRLTAGIGFVTKVGVRIAADARQIVEVTHEQFSALQNIEVNNRVAVKGFAGTGKTLLAQEHARRLAARGKSVLLLFFNRTLANTVRGGFERDAGVECITFHSLARRLITEDESGWWEAQDSSAEGFWDTTVPLRLFEVPAGSLPKYDAVIIDEGQDFKKEWFEFLETLLGDKKDGRLVTFYDEDQDIFGHWDDLPWPGVTRSVLARNCRSTKSIVNYLTAQRPNGMTSFERSPAGAGVKVRRVTDPEQERAAVIADVTALLRGDVPPGSIVLMLNKPKRESCLGPVHDIDGCRLEGVDRHYCTDTKSIRFTNINTFKGLEADVVFLLDCLDMQQDEFKQAVYVQGSRARTLLYVYKRLAGKG